MTLIENYETHPCLYNPKHKFYSNKHARNEALQKITEAVAAKNSNFTVEDIKNLKSGIGSDEVYEPSVWWYEKLFFLVPHVKNRKSKSTLDFMTIETNADSPEDWQETERSSDISTSGSILSEAPCNYKLHKKEKGMETKHQTS
ncbi:hypothetical protein ABEB36_009261 [Hypothenemus hampei]|uniref:MADF domain-containing protein n=1 Tax=Hypothenemus hampei TaxID=57062 RepID=A0ABD1EFU3_HYPHA